jgi:hypothetical protein
MARKKRNSSRELQIKSLHKAHNHGQPWSDDEVSRLVAGIGRDETSFEMALSVGRSYYSTMSARGKVSFALRQANALYGPLRQEVAKGTRLDPNKKKARYIK